MKCSRCTGRMIAAGDELVCLACGHYHDCTHAPGKGMCRSCMPSMFPSPVQELKHREWFARYREMKS